ncbi:MAG: hypothetical protein HDS25_02265 [Bacteroides sp.]|nr:hypothetical protein [Bacteroidales bacterium]MBD5295127.1 hypothetical protein [Bacteroides sp.]
MEEVLDKSVTPSGTQSQGMVTRLKNLFQTNPSNQPLTQPKQTNIKESGETYHAWGVRWGGNAGANHTALSPALQSCYTQNVNEQRNNQQAQQKIQTQLKSKIESLKGKRQEEELKLETQNRQKERLNEEIKSCQNKIHEIKQNDGTNIMAKVNFIIGTTITILLAIYLFVFYSSASFSAFFGNANITSAGQAILDSHCYAEAAANGLGELLFILLMPVIFLGLGFLIHQFGESGKGGAKYIKITALYLVTFIFDALLAFEISQKVYEYTVLSNTEYTVSMAINSPNFWIVIFSGFVAYVIWGLVFDFTLQHFDNMNAHTKEIEVLEDKIRNAKLNVDKVEDNISKIKMNMNGFDTEIAQLTKQLQENNLIDTNELKRALSDFFSGWLAYMSLAAKSQAEKDQASETYKSFLNQIQIA